MFPISVFLSLFLLTVGFGLSSLLTPATEDQELPEIVKEHDPIAVPNKPEIAPESPLKPAAMPVEPQESFDDVLAMVHDELDSRERPAKDAKLVWSEEDGWVVHPEDVGKKVINRKKTANHIAKKIHSGERNPDDSRSYFALYENVEPNYTQYELAPLQVAAQAASENALELTVDFTPVEIIDLTINPSEWIEIDYASMLVQLNEKKLRAYVAELASKYDVEPGEVTITGTDSYRSDYNGRSYQKARIEGEARVGWKINQEKLYNDIQSALNDPEVNAIEMAIEKHGMKVNSTVEGMEFPDLVSSGKSDYSLGNGPDRVHNVALGVDTLSMAVIPPGETFSVSELLAWVTPEKGYKDALVLFGSAAAPAPGGGLCQVSTTMYRAAIFAGFPIKQRKPHSWDISYYRDFHGVDAAVYPPGEVDLRFTNDSPGYIFVHGYLERDRETAYFDFYGIDDGREVAVETTLNQRWGEGSTVINDWTITRPDGSVENREIYSYYHKYYH